MSDSPPLQIKQLAATHGVIRSRDVEALGIHRKHLRAMVDSGALEQVGRGLYRLADAEPTEQATVAEVFARVPTAVLCLESALAWHGLTTQAPHDVWIAIPVRSWVPVGLQAQVRVFQMTPRWMTEGVDTINVDGITGGVTNPARTVVDCFRFRNAVGHDVALGALREILDRRLATPAQLYELARERRVLGTMRPYIEAMVA